MATTPIPEPILVTTNTPVELTPQQAARESVEEKYARLYPNNQPVPIVVGTTTSSETPNELLEMVRGLRTEVEGLRTRMPAPPEPAPIKPLTPWFEELRQGEWEKAEKDLTERIRASVLTEARTQATNEAVERMTVQNEVDRYLASVRVANPEIVSFERYLQAPVQARVQADMASGKVTNSADFIKSYKLAVDEEVKSIREISQQYRAAGKGEATIRSRDVLNATPLSPQAVSNPEGAQSVVPDVTPESYFADRLAKNASIRGMGPT